MIAESKHIPTIIEITFIMYKMKYLDILKVHENIKIGNLILVSDSELNGHSEPSIFSFALNLHNYTSFFF